MPRELTEAERCVLYFDWRTRWLMPRPYGEPLRKGDEFGAEVFRDGRWVRLRDPKRKGGGRA